MAYVDTFTAGSASADRYSTLLELLTQLPDNTASLIQARDVRDSIYSLWARVDDVQSIALTAASASVLYSNSNPTPVTVGGISAGTTFPAPQTMQQMWDALLYPYVAPGNSLLISSNSTREYGSSTAVVLNWSVTKNSYTINSIIVDGVPQVPTGNSQAGVKLATATHSIVPVSPSTSQVYSMSVGDGTTTPTTTATLTWSTRIYWGKIDFSSIGNPNLTTNPGSASICASIATDTIIENLTGANANSQAFGSELATSKSKTYTGIDGGGQYLIFAWPNIVSNPYTPTFTVNGLPNTAFTRIRTNSPFFRSLYGYSGIEYEVWVSNTRQNSPLNIVVS